MKKCIECSNEFKPSSRHLRCPSCRAKATKTLCECGLLKQLKSKTCKKCTPKLTAQNNPNWRGGKTYHKKGYIMIRIGSEYRFEHTLIMEEMLGRHLLPDENVHHRNGIKDDNRPENLELWIKPQPTGIRVCDALQWAREIIQRYENQFPTAP